MEDIADGLKRIDSSGVAFKQFAPGVGPYGEPQLVKLAADYLNSLPAYLNCVQIMRTPDLLIRGQWALEIKIARPFGDNGKLAENWSVNLLHPYPGNTSLLGDCLKLRSLDCQELKGVVAIGYEHDPPLVALQPLLEAFEAIARQVLHIEIGSRAEARRNGLIHPVHQTTAGRRMAGLLSDLRSGNAITFRHYRTATRQKMEENIPMLRLIRRWFLS